MGLYCRERDILLRWKTYFEKMLNEENERLVRGDREPNNQEVPEVTRREEEIALKKLKTEPLDPITYQWKYGKH